MSFVDPKHTGIDRELREDQLAENPILQFQVWWNDAFAAQLSQPEAMTLATCTVEGKPSARMVLMRGFDQNGFLFYTNYESRKSQELLANPVAALVFFWEPLERQVRIEGVVEKATAEESDSYYSQRPKGSRVGAWASPQSEVIANRQVLEQRVAEMERKFAATDDVPRPENWGGFRVIPHTIEFWQGRESRLHDRFRYRLVDNVWVVNRLAP